VSAGRCSGLARRILMPWTCRKDRQVPVVRRRGGGGGSDGLCKRRRDQVHPAGDADDGARRTLFAGRRVWKNLFPVNGRSVNSLSNNPIRINRAKGFLKKKLDLFEKRICG